MAQFWYVVLLAWLARPGPMACLDNGLALTPPMGWMSWQRYRCTTNCDLYPYECISEWLFRNATDLLVSQGYADAVYKYVIIDDCWLARDRDEDGKLQPDPKRFPSGIKALADYVHSKGLKFGIYEDIGTKTCAGYPGSEGHFEIDTQTFAEWGVDYVKLDGCNGKNFDEMYPEYGRFLNKTGRPIVYSCSWPAYQSEPIKWKSIAEHCNLWRVDVDISDSWSSIQNIMNDFGYGKKSYLAQYAGPGHWNDPDMLVIGNFGLSVWEAQAQMAVWAVLAAPLIMSNDLASVKPEFKEILQNKRVIAINQDPLGIQGKFIGARDENINIWVRPISPKVGNHYSFAVAFVNNGTDGKPHLLNVTIESLGMRNPSGYIVTDLFGTSDSETATGDLLKPSSFLIFRVVPSGVKFFELRAVLLQSKNKNANKRML